MNAPVDSVIVSDRDRTIEGVPSAALQPSPSGPLPPPPPRAAPAVTLEGLVKVYGAFVWRSVLRLGVSPGDVDDVTQLVFLKARERLSEIPHEGAKGFLYRLALGIASNHKRSRRRLREASFEDEGVQEAVERSSAESPATRSPWSIPRQTRPLPRALRQGSTRLLLPPRAP